jgi:hypothetical protein
VRSYRPRGASRPISSLSPPTFNDGGFLLAPTQRLDEAVECATRSFSGTASTVGALCKLHPVQLTRPIAWKAPGFNPCVYEVMDEKLDSKFRTHQCNLCRYAADPELAIDWALGEALRGRWEDPERLKHVRWLIRIMLSMSMTQNKKGGDQAVLYARMAKGGAGGAGTKDDPIGGAVQVACS